MKGLELAENYYRQIGLPAMREAFPDDAGNWAMGLAGEGSECLGFDDEGSRDHDWGPGFCVWLSDRAYDQYGRQAQQVYDSLPEEFMGYRRLNTCQGQGRVGVMRISDFYRRYTGTDRAPLSWQNWRLIPENGLAVVTNGRVFQDVDGEFSRIRGGFMAYYPEDYRRKKLSRYCALAAQQGQYNYIRCLKHGEPVAAFQALAEFIADIQTCSFLLLRTYKPYYKWTQRRLREICNTRMTALPGILEQLAAGSEDKMPLIEQAAGIIIDELRYQGLSGSPSDYLMDHAEKIQGTIEDDTLRGMHIMGE